MVLGEPEVSQELDDRFILSGERVVWASPEECVGQFELY